MSVVFETYNTDGRLQFANSRVPYAYLGKMIVGANAGLLLTSTAKNQNNQAPTMSPDIERVGNLIIPTGTRLIAVSGTKFPYGTAYNPANNQMAFIGVRSGISTFYFFGDYVANPATSGPVLELYDTNNKLIFDLRTKPLSIINQSTSLVNIPAGKTYAALAVMYGASNTYSGRDPNQYQYLYSGGPGTSNGQVGMFGIMIDVIKATGADNIGGTQRNGSCVIVDVTGY